MDLDSVRILCNGGIYQQGHGCHPMLDLKEAAENVPMIECSTEGSLLGRNETEKYSKS